MRGIILDPKTGRPEEHERIREVRGLEDPAGEGGRFIRVPKGMRVLSTQQISEAIERGYAKIVGDVLVPQVSGGSRQFWQETLAWATADGAAVATSITETIVFPDVTIPGNYMQDGRHIRGVMYGRYGTTATPTLRFRIRWGGVAGTVLADSGVITGGSTVTNAIWRLEYMIQTRANGASGSVFCTGQATLFSGLAPTVGSATGAPGIAGMGSAGVTAPAAVTVSLVADTALSVTVLWSASNALNTITGHNYTIESIN